MIRWIRRRLVQDDYWHGFRAVSGQFVPGKLEGYPNDLSAKTAPFEGPRDALGIPLVDYGGQVGPVLHPATACQVALGWHERFLADRDPESLRRFLAIADWLVQHQRPWGGGGAWLNEVAKAQYRVPAPWASALVQGQAISALVRAAQYAGEPKRYLASAESAFELFLVDVAHGGVRTEDESGVAFEEYPSPRPSMVLNGLVSALWGVMDLATATGSQRVREAFDAGVGALLRRLPRYDLGFWSRYCLFPFRTPNVASPYYHREHIAQLEAMSLIHPDPRWRECADRWRSYQRRGLNRAAALAAKAAWRISWRW